MLSEGIEMVKGKKMLCGAALLAAAFWIAPLRAEVVTVADCERDAAIDFWAASDVKFCRDVMDEVFALAGVEPQRAEYDADGMLVVSNAEVICSAFRTPKLMQDYDFCIQPLGRMHYALYVTPDRAELMTSIKITDWPRIKVAYSPVSQGRDADRENYFEHAHLSPEYVEYRTSIGAVDALKNNEVDVLFLYTPYGKRPEGLEEIVPIGMRNVYFAVRKDRPDLLRRLAAAYREWYIDNIDKFDQWRLELLGITPPAKRVRIGAYSRGDLFQVSPDGARTGIVEDWIRSLCAITHWTPDYVYGNYDESLDDVKNGRLDLVGGIGFAANRSNSFMYPHTPIGMLRVYMWCRPDKPYMPGRPESWRGMKIGLLAGTPSSRRVKASLEKQKYGIEVKEFSSGREMRKAYYAGEIDAIVDVEMSELAKERALRLYASHPMYLVSAPGKKDLFDELEHALDAICDDFPKYMRMTTERHYGTHSELSELTIQESEWLVERQKDPTPIKLDFSPWPFQIKDDLGKAEGFPKAFLDVISKRTGLKFVLAPQTGVQTAEAKFLRGDTQFWIPYPERPESAVYGAISVFSLPVPQSAGELYGAADLRTEFEMFTHRDTPDELVSILRKTVAGLDPMQLQEMFLAAAAERRAERRFFGLTDAELKLYSLAIGVVVLLIVTIYASIMIVMLKRHAKRADEAAKIAQDFALAKTRFLAMMSHELRTPLNAVIGFAEFLAKDGIEEARRKEYVKGILKSATALLELINNILDFSKLEAGEFNIRDGECDVKQIVNELPAIFGYRVHQRGITLEVRKTSEADVPAHVKFSHQGLRQVLLNIVGNAAKFTDAGRITVEYGWNPEKGNLHLEVFDTGRGISPEKMKHLFDPFAQDISSRMHEANGDETKGTGLGLPIVKKLVDCAKGTISAKSILGEGTRFTIDIPGLETIEKKPDAAPAAKPEPEPDPLVQQKTLDIENKRILVVDDMAMNRKILGIHLTNLGAHHVKFAENGVRALEVMKDWVPDFVLTDMWMPEMDGSKLAEAMSEDPRLIRVPLVAITADVDVDSTYDMSRFARVMAKPVTSAKLSLVLKEIG